MSTTARIVLRPIGNPLPLGFLALALDDARHRTLLQVGRRTPLRDGLPPLEREAGVREEL
jgi:hypothetical protein